MPQAQWGNAATSQMHPKGPTFELYVLLFQQHHAVLEGVNVWIVCLAS